MHPRQEDEAPVIHVTIGRIDVRAVQSAQAPQRPQLRAAPKVSLDDYLKRCGGRRE